MRQIPPPDFQRIANLEKLMSQIVKRLSKIEERQLGQESEDFKRKKDILAIKKKIRKIL